MKSILDCIMKPESIAVIGASTNPVAVGYNILKKLVEFNYQGKIYPINPKASEILGQKVYKNILDVKDSVDLAVIAVPRDAVFGVIDQCNEKGIKSVVLITAGFKEIGGEGSELEEELGELIQKYGMRLLGPNCMGVINTEPSVSMNATFPEIYPIPGNVAFISQSGALGIAVLNVAKDMNIGMSQFVSMGNKLNISENDLLEYWEKDENTDIILLYVESFVDTKRFQELCTRISKKKPIIVIKSGTSDAGAAAAASHTGALAGADNSASAMFTQCGVIRENTMQNMFEVTQAFANSPLPKGKRVAILTDAGGPGIMCTDAAIAHGLDVVRLAESTTKKLIDVLPSQASVRNPVDTIAAVTTEAYEKSLHYLLEDPNVDAVLAIIVPLAHISGYDCARIMMKAQEKYNKPVLGIVMSTDEEYKKICEISDLKMIPVFKFPESAAYAFSKMYEYTQWQQKPFGKIKQFSDIDRNLVDRIIDTVLKEKRDMLTTLESMNVLKAYGINTCKYAEAKDVYDAIKKADEIGYPVVMKILSKTVSHKSDVGGVIVNIQNGEELSEAYNNMIAKAKEHNVYEHIDAVMIQEMLKGQREIVIGSSIDPQFGPLIMFGLGGIFIEAMKDVAFKVHPITDQDAKDMIESTNAYKLLKGYRGLKAVDMQYLQDQLLRLSQLISDYSFIDELDINPYIVCDTSGEPMAVDGRIKLNTKVQKL